MPWRGRAGTATRVRGGRRGCLGGRRGRIAAVAVTLRRGAVSAVRARRWVRTPEVRERSGVRAWSGAREKGERSGGRRGSPRNPASAPRRLGGGRPISRCLSPSHRERTSIDPSSRRSTRWWVGQWWGDITDAGIDPSSRRSVGPAATPASSFVPPPRRAACRAPPLPPGPLPRSPPPGALRPRQGRRRRDVSAPGAATTERRR